MAGKIEFLCCTRLACYQYVLNAGIFTSSIFSLHNIFHHFATAYFGLHLKGELDKQAYFDVVPNGRDAVYSMDRDGKPTATHTYWKGFKRATAVGLILEHAKP
ncbi:MAG: hypothetical protein AAB403_20860 [Planctomycetota bacterium]